MFACHPLCEWEKFLSAPYLLGNSKNGPMISNKRQLKQSPDDQDRQRK